MKSSCGAEGSSAACCFAYLDLAACGLRSLHEGRGKPNLTCTPAPAPVHTCAAGAACRPQAVNRMVVFNRYDAAAHDLWHSHTVSIHSRRREGGRTECNMGL